MHSKLMVCLLVLGITSTSCCMVPHLLHSGSHGSGHDGGCMSGHGASEPVSPGSTTDSLPAGGAVYRCPMHPAMTATFPSQCPECRMNLEREVR